MVYNSIKTMKKTVKITKKLKKEKKPQVRIIKIITKEFKN